VDGIGELHFMLSKPGSERQRSHAFSHMWKIDLIQIQALSYTHTHIYIYVSKSGTVRGDDGREKGGNNDKVNIMKCITSI
jgi:hypothetical protein